MTKIDIFSGFLGAGKTTLIKKLIEEAYKGEKLVLIENEFGEIGIDGGFLQDAGVEITEMNSGCICCSLVGDFGQALEQVLFQFKPDRVIIEPSGVGKLSDVIGAVQKVENHDIQLNAFVTVADASKCKIYMKNFGEFYNNQIEHAAAIVLSRTGGMSEKKLMDAVKLLREHNPNAPIITTPWEELDGKQILETMENKDTLKEELARLAAEQAAKDIHDHGPDCTCGCHDHDHDDHDHEHHHHHHADEVFVSWGIETPRKFSEAELRAILDALQDEAKYGIVLRAKGIVDASDGEWIYFDYVPGETDIRRGGAAVTGRFCVIGSKLNEQALKELFKVE